MESSMGIAPAGSMAGMDMEGMDMEGMDMSGMEGMGMSAPTWSWTGAAAFIAMWTVMMAAMMLPAAAPMILVFAAAQARRARTVTVPTWIFVAGYIAVWAAAGVLAYALVQAAGAVAAGMGAEALARWAPRALGLTLIVAGLYQFTPFKRVCLSHCRSPMAFVAQHWRDGRIGALRMGLAHGAYCLGCCWALFAVLLAAGMMSLAWMLLLTVVVFVEKVFPHGRRAAPVIGIALAALGLALLFGIVPAAWIV
jgi:predicted metal-binding membrane protein